jgi:hydrogenase nickel incorporation protein HypA/HybF
MHEYSIAQTLIARVEREARARHACAVRRLTVRIGDLAGVNSALLATAYATLREGTLCAPAPLRIRRVAARWDCPACRTTLGPGEVLTCPGCGQAARLAGGDEILLDDIEMEVP